VLARVRRAIFFPDNQVGWLPFGLIAALRAHRQTPVDAVFSTFPPMTSHLIAGLFRRITGVPWVAEFRDPWIGNALEAPPSWFYRRLRTKMERWVVRSADELICVTPTLAEMYRRRYPGARVTLIRNGYDRSETRPHPPTLAADRYRIVYTGTLDRPAEFATFLDGVAHLAGRRPDLAKRLRIDIYGRVADGCRVIADRHAANGLDGIVEFHGFVGRDEVLDAVAAGDAALVLLGPGPGMDLFVPGKLYDYLGQDRPVLAMLPDGDARDLLEDIGWGTLARPEPDRVASAIERLMDGPAPTGPADPDGRFDRAALAAQLADVLDAAVDPMPVAPAESAA
jgi:glycosyltransferase involved in cell wall biosynthesis